MNLPGETARRTKIMVTAGPASESEACLCELIAAGVDAIRLNMAHAPHAWIEQIVPRIRQASLLAGREVAIVMDVKGPEVRTGKRSEPLLLEKGNLVDLTVPGAPSPDDSDGAVAVEVNYPGIVQDLQPGGTVLVDSGLIQLRVVAKSTHTVRCEVLVGGLLGSRRHLNLPGVRVRLPALTEQDRRDAELGIRLRVDYLALSFTRSAGDVDELREFLRIRNSTAGIIAKVEDQCAMRNLDEIVAACDVLMIARGDLGIECPCEDIPSMQRQAIVACRRLGRPVIVATHLLESMITQPVPTRAEVSDVANAVADQVDCVMLSGETAVGKYPVACVQMLDRIARRTELNPSRAFCAVDVTTDRGKVLRSAVMLAGEFASSALMTFTQHGTMPNGLAAFRPSQSRIFAATTCPDLLRRLRLVWGVEPVVQPADLGRDRVASMIRVLCESGFSKSGDRIIVATELDRPEAAVESVQLRLA